MPPESRTFPARLEQLASATAFIEGQAAQAGLPPERTPGLLVSLEEAFVNICHYAYPKGDGTVTITCETIDHRLVIEIVDQGVPFDLLSLPEPDITQDLMEREIGGLGVHFIRTFSDQVSYRREAGQNILRLEFVLQGADSD